MQIKLNASNTIVGEDNPVYVVAEIGINWDGDFAKVYELMRMAKLAGVDAVKFQCRTPRVSTPRAQWNVPKLTPWGETMPYIKYREKMEFTLDQWWKINDYAHNIGIDWFTSVWDIDAVMFLRGDNLSQRMVAWKVPSAMLTNYALLGALHVDTMPIILSTGMSTWREILTAVGLISNPLVLMHCHSAYPAPVEELNLNMLQAWSEREELKHAVLGYSGHETGLATTVVSVALGAKVIERHVTLDRSSVGTDHAGSTEAVGLAKLIRDIRSVENALGQNNHNRQTWASEMAARKKLRGD